MYLFSRSTRLGPSNQREAMEWSVNVTQKVNQISELEVSLWTTVFSPAVGTLAWTAAAETLAQLEATNDKLVADDSYLSLVEEGAKFSSGDAIDDAVVQLILSDADAANTQPQYATVVQAVLTPGSSVRGIEIGVEIAQRVKKVTGRPTSFGAALAGPYGGVGWFIVYDTVEQLQAAGEAIDADASFVQFVDKEASKLYQVGATVQTAYRRII